MIHPSHFSSEASCSVSNVPFLGGCLIIGALVWPMAALAQSGPGPCRVLSITDEGPFDYRTHSKYSRVVLMERAHFSPQTEALLRGTSRVDIAPDLEFVFRYTPNHHRALAAFMKLALREKTDKPRTAQYTARCHFERAIDWRPDDTAVRIMFADYLLKTGQESEGLDQLGVAKQLQPDNPFTQYNVGLVYAESRKFDLALEQAHKALELDFPRTELRKMLEAAGRWRDPEPKAKP